MSTHPNDTITSLAEMETVDLGEVFACTIHGVPAVFQCVSAPIDGGHRLWASPGVSGAVPSGDVWMFLELQSGPEGKIVLRQILSALFE